MIWMPLQPMRSLSSVLDPTWRWRAEVREPVCPRQQHWQSLPWPTAAAAIALAPPARRCHQPRYPQQRCTDDCNAHLWAASEPGGANLCQSNLPVVIESPCRPFVSLGATGKRPQRPVVLSRYGRGRCFGVERRLWAGRRYGIVAHAGAAVAVVGSCALSRASRPVVFSALYLTRRACCRAMSRSRATASVLVRRRCASSRPPSWAAHSSRSAGAHVSMVVADQPCSHRQAPACFPWPRRPGVLCCLLCCLRIPRRGELYVPFGRDGVLRLSVWRSKSDWADFGVWGIEEGVLRSSSVPARVGVDAATASLRV